MDLGENKVLEFRAAILGLYLLIASLAGAVVVPTYYIVGIDLLTFVCIVFTLLSIVIFAMRRQGRVELAFASRLFLLSFLLSCIAGLYLGNELLDNKPWQLLVPITVFTLLGAREARRWILTYIAAIVTVLAWRGEAYELLSSAVFLIAFVTLSVAMDVFTRFNEQNIRTIARLSHTDSLTGVYNRQLFMELSRNELNRARRVDEPLTIYMIDIDHFKAFNDRYGHVTGDSALTNVAQAIRTTARRASDLVFRYGGEEFCVVSSGLSADEARQLGDLIIDNVRALSIRHALSQGGVLTVSVGLAYCDHLSGMSVERILQSADAALYEAKSRGRDRLVVSFNNTMEASTTRRAG